MTAKLSSRQHTSVVRIRKLLEHIIRSPDEDSFPLAGLPTVESHDSWLRESDRQRRSFGGGRVQMSVLPTIRSTVSDAVAQGYEPNHHGSRDHWSQIAFESDVSRVLLCWLSRRRERKTRPQ